MDTLLTFWHYVSFFFLFEISSFNFCLNSISLAYFRPLVEFVDFTPFSEALFLFNLLIYSRICAIFLFVKSDEIAFLSPFWWFWGKMIPFWCLWGILSVVVEVLIVIAEVLRVVQGRLSVAKYLLRIKLVTLNSYDANSWHLRR